MNGMDYILLLLGMGVVTFLPRWLPLIYLTRMSLPKWFTDWLDLIPAAILSAILLPALITSGDPKQLVILRPELFVAVPVFGFAWKTKSLGGTVIVGMFLYWLAGKFF